MALVYFSLSIIERKGNNLSSRLRPLKRETTPETQNTGRNMLSSSIRRKKGSGTLCLSPWKNIGKRLFLYSYLSHIVRKPDFCLCENKGADQLRSNCEADQRLCFHYMDSTIPLLPKSEITSIYLSSVAAQTGLCQTRSENPKTGFLTSRLI